MLLIKVDFPGTGPSQSKHDAESNLTLQVPVSIYHDDTGVPDKGALGVAGDVAAGSPGQGSFLGELVTDSEWPGGKVHDGLADPEFLQAVLTQLADGDLDMGGLRLWLNPNFGMEVAPVSGLRLVTSEQSNSSVIFNSAGKTLIAKFFRVVHEGVHPEVEIGMALGRPGDQRETLHVPTLQAVVSGREKNATLFVVHDFIAGAKDGWEVALAAAASGADFAPEARAIGVELAKVHASLRSSLAVHPVQGDEVAAFVQGVGARLESAWGLAGAAVGPYESQLREVVAQLEKMDALPPLQRIHGDLHLGQLLFKEAGPEKGWYILDFEGEPLRPLADRGTPDVALRDLAGMLRSFDYAAAQAPVASAAGSEPAAPAAALWVENCSLAFIDGYESVIGERVSRADPLFVALLLDKALYEIVYELHNRPDWVWVPVDAVREMFQSRKVE